MESLFQLNAGLRDNPIWAISLGPIDEFLGISGAGYAAGSQGHQNIRRNLLSEIRALDPNYREAPSITSGPFEQMSLEGQANVISQLRADYAAVRYRVCGEIGPLQIETLRLLQRGADIHYREGQRLYDQGLIEPGLPRELAVGRYVDGANRRELSRFCGETILSLALVRRSG